MSDHNQSQPDIDEIIERDRQRREAEGFGYRQPLLRRQPQPLDSWWEDH